MPAALQADAHAFPKSPRRSPIRFFPQGREQMRDDPTESQTATAPLPSTFVSHFEPGLPAFSAARDWPAASAGVMVRLGVSDGVSALVGAEAGGGFRGAKMIAFGGGRMQTSTACQLSLMLRPRSIVARSTLGEADVTSVKILAGKDDPGARGATKRSSMHPVRLEDVLQLVQRGVHAM
jgi:hypothetical protein